MRWRLTAARAAGAFAVFIFFRAPVLSWIGFSILDGEVLSGSEMLVREARTIAGSGLVLPIRLFEAGAAVRVVEREVLVALWACLLVAALACACLPAKWPYARLAGALLGLASAVALINVDDRALLGWSGAPPVLTLATLAPLAAAGVLMVVALHWTRVAEYAAATFAWIALLDSGYEVVQQWAIGWGFLGIIASFAAAVWLVGFEPAEPEAPSEAVRVR